MSMDLNELADRVEALDGPDREIDALIAAACRMGAEAWAWAENYPDWEGRSDGRVYLERGGPSFAAYAYTASIDTATSVFAADTMYRSGHSALAPDPSMFFCDAVTADGDSIHALARTEAIARLAAALRTKALGAVHTLTEGN